MPPSEKIRVLIVDDHAIVRRGLRGLLEIVDDMEVVGDAADGEQAVRLAGAHAPDVILMDLVMPVMDGIAAIRVIKPRHPAIEIVALTSFIDEEKVVAALEAGAAGYLLKDADEHEVIAAIRAAYGGEVRLDPAVAQLLAERFRRRPAAPPVDPLTERELDVLVLLGRGLSQQGDRRRAGHRRLHGAHPRQQRPWQARSREPHTGRSLRGRARRHAEVGDGRTDLSRRTADAMG